MAVTIPPRTMADPHGGAATGGGIAGGEPPVRPGSGAPGSLRALGYASVTAAYLLVVMGGVVRATGSGLGCPDWPLCHGQLAPPAERAAAIEYSHRALAAVTAVLAVGAVALWVRWRGRRSSATGWGVGIIGLLLGQIAIGAAAVVLELPPAVVLVHLGLAMLFLGSLTAIAVDVTWPPAAAPTSVVAADRRDARFRRLALGATVAVYLLILTGAYVRASGASWACVGFPLCNGELLPVGSGRLVDIHLLHRLVAYGVAAHLLVTVVAAWRKDGAAIRGAASVVALFLLVQIGVGAELVSTGVSQLAQVLHVGGAAGLWASTVAFLAIGWRSH